MTNPVKQNIVALFGDDTEKLPPPTAIPIDHLFSASEQRAPATGTAIDLTGRPKILFLVGAGATGKTTFARWVGERAYQRSDDTYPVMVSVDPQSRDLALYFNDIHTPRKTGQEFVVEYLERLFTQLMRTKRSAIIDFGGGDSALLALIAGIPDLHEMLSQGGVEPVAMHFISTRSSDLVHLAALHRAGFTPTATALMLNVGRTNSKDIDTEFARVRAQPEYHDAIKRGAVEVLFPKLYAAAAIEARQVGFWAATNHAPGTEGMAPLNIFDHRKVAKWLDEMEGQMAPIASWLDLG